MSVAAHTERPATYADLEALPENVKGEIIDGVLTTYRQADGEWKETAVYVDDEKANIEPFDVIEARPQPVVARRIAR